MNISKIILWQVDGLPPHRRKPKGKRKMTMSEYQKELQQANEVELIKERKRLFALIKKEIKTLIKQQEKATDALNWVEACINNLNIMEQDIQIINTTLQQKRFLKLEADENCKFDSEM